MRSWTNPSRRPGGTVPWRRLGALALVGGVLAASGGALAQDDEKSQQAAGEVRVPGATPGVPLVPPVTPKPATPADEPAPRGGEATVSTGEGGPGGVTTKKVPCIQPNTKVTMDYVDAPLMDVTKYMAEITCRNFILSDDLKGQITIISHQQVSVAEAYEAYLSALEVAGYTTVTVGKNTKVVATSKASNAPLRVYEGSDIPATDNFVTQIVELDNVSVSEVSAIVKEMAGPSAKVIAYAPTNTLIITDAAYNIRRVYRIVKQLDVAAPKSKMEVIALRYAAATDIERILEEVYGVAGATTASAQAASGSAASTRASRRRQAEPEPAATATNVGAEGTYISKIIADERTNSLIVLANEEAIAALRELIARLDVDIDPASRSQIHVVYLEHAKAQDVANVLSNLADGRSSGSSASGTRTSTSSSRTATGAARTTNTRSSGGGTSQSFGGMNRGRPEEPGGAGPEGVLPPPGVPGGAPAAGGAAGGVVAAFDSGMRITADENTNSLVIIAAPEDFRVLKGVIDRLDIPRRQVYVEAVVVEVGSEDSLELGVAAHGGAPNGESGLSYLSGQLNASSVFLPVDTAGIVSGLAMGVLGQSLEVSIPDGTGGSIPVTIPAFGIALNALASNSEVSILSNPNLLVVDNEEASISVGRNVPFPVSSGYSTSGLPVTSFQREDVGITLAVTPQINEANYVTMEISLEVAEVEGDVSSIDAASGGPITSSRKTENVVVVRDNQTIVIGGLIGTTETEIETKIPVLGDIPLLGVLFRGKGTTERKTNLLIFLTPHVINEPADLEEVLRVKMAQREEFLRRFYGRSREEQEREFQALMMGSMNFVDQPSQYRTKSSPVLKSDTIEVSNVPAAPPVETVPQPADTEVVPPPAEEAP